MGLTIAERERRAYIEGRVEEAKVLAELEDTQRRIDGCEYDEDYPPATAIAILNRG